MIERCISSLNFIHNDIRNVLLEEKVDDLLMIYLNGDSWKNYKPKELYIYLKEVLKFIK